MYEYTNTKCFVSMKVMFNPLAARSNILFFVVSPLFLKPVSNDSFRCVDMAFQRFLLWVSRKAVP